MGTPDFPDRRPVDAAPATPRSELGLPPEALVQPNISQLSPVDLPEGFVPAGKDGLSDEDLMKPPRLSDREVPDEEPDNTQKQPGTSGRPEEPGDQSEDPVSPDATNGGEGAGGGPPDRAPGEADDEEWENFAELLREECLEEIRLNRILLASDQMNDEEKRCINAAAVELTSASLGNPRLKLLSDPTPEESVAMHFAQLDSSEDRNAYDALRQELVVESISAQISADMEDQPNAKLTPDWQAALSEGRTQQPRLEAAIRECEARGMSPTEWIEAGVGELNEEAREAKRTDLLVRHYARVVSAGKADQAFKDDANMYVVGLDAEAIGRTGTAALRAASDPDITGLVAQKYIEAVETNLERLRGNDQNAYARAKNIINESVDIVDNPLLATDDVRELGELLHRTHAAISIRPFGQNYMDDVVHLGKQVAVYEIQLMVRNGETPDNVMAACDWNYAKRTELPSDKRDTLYPPGVLEQTAAIAFTKREDTENAKILAEQCPEPKTYQETMQACWRHARTLGQVRRLEPREGLWGGDEDAQKHHEFAIATRSEDPDKLASYIRIAIDIPASLPSTYGSFQAAAKLVKRLSTLDQSQAEIISHSILQTLTLRGERNTMGNAQPFIDVLTNSNNPEYFSSAFKAVRNAQGAPNEKLLPLAKLAKALAQKRRPGTS